MNINVRKLCIIMDMLNSEFQVIIRILSYQVKTQYVQILNITDTSIKRAMSGQSTPMVQGCTDIIMFVMVDTAFTY